MAGSKPSRLRFHCRCPVGSAEVVFVAEREWLSAEELMRQLDANPESVAKRAARAAVTPPERSKSSRIRRPLLLNLLPLALPCRPSTTSLANSLLRILRCRFWLDI